MYRIDVESAVSGTPSYGAAGPVATGMFTDGLPGVADGTIPGAEWFNHVMMELCKAVIDDGMALDKADDGQLATRLSPLKALVSGSATTGAATTTHQRAGLAIFDCSASGGQAAAIASSGVSVPGTQSAAIAAFMATTASGIMSLAAACQSSTISGTRAAALASNACVVLGENIAAIASVSCTIDGDQTAALACDNLVTATAGSQLAGVASLDCTLAGTNVAAVGSQDCSSTSTADKGAMVASADCTLKGDSGATIACSDCDIDTGSVRAALIASEGAAISGSEAVVLAGNNCELNSNASVAGGWAGAPIATIGANQNLTWRFDNATGDLYSDGTVGAGAADFAEYFENQVPGVLPVGHLVTWDNGVRLATEADEILGVVSAEPLLVGNAAPLGWHGRWLRDEWGRKRMRENKCVSWAKRERVTRTPVVTRPGYSGPLEAAPTPHPEDARRWVAPDVVMKAVEERVGGTNAAGAAALEAILKRLPGPVARPIRAAAAKAGSAMRGEVRFRVVPEVTAREFIEWRELAHVEETVEVFREGYAGLVENAPTSEFPEDARFYTVTAPIPNPDFDPAKPYQARSERPDQYTCVALVGQVRVAVTPDVKPGDHLWADEKGRGWPGVGPRITVMAIETPAGEDRDFAIARAFIR